LAAQRQPKTIIDLLVGCCALLTFSFSFRF